jgi:hypothetical protein
MALEIVWRNPIPPEKTEWRVEPVAVLQHSVSHLLLASRFDSLPARSPVVTETRPKRHRNFHLGFSLLPYSQQQQR